MQNPSFLKNKRITVFGLGLNMGGVGTVAFLAEAGAREIIVTDIKKKSELAASLEKLKKYKNITYVLGQYRPEDFTRVDMVVKNPGISWKNEYILLAKKHKVPVEMDSSLFFRFCPAPIIGVTGTKGKTTTASLIAHILERAGKKVVRAGISQVGVLSQLSKATADAVVVFELSSWRLSPLQDLKKSPHIAVFTNFYPDHLNYYKTLEAYLEDKKNIFRFQKGKDILVANADNPAVREAAEEAPGSVLWFSAGGSIPGSGAWIENNVLFVREADHDKVLFPLEKISLTGEHNRGNVLASALACLAYGLKPKMIREGVETFVGVPHRLEFVREKDQVRYYNDSAATIPEAALSALKAFAGSPVIFVGGWSDKELDFEALAIALSKQAKKAILFAGGGTDKLEKILARLCAQEKYVVVRSMAEALAEAEAAKAPGEVVLLSPGAASFGVFSNEFDRGAQFRNQVKALL